MRIDFLQGSVSEIDLNGSAADKVIPTGMLTTKHLRSGFYLLSFELETALSLRPTAWSEDVRPDAMDAPVSGVPDSSSDAPVRIFGGSVF